MFLDKNILKLNEKFGTPDIITKIIEDNKSSIINKINNKENSIT